MSNHDKYRTHHASRRLRGFDYTRPAAYFVTVCAHERRCLFVEITAEKMHLSEAGRIVEEWQRSEEMPANVQLDAFVIMPNHVHGILAIVPPTVNRTIGPHGYDIASAHPNHATDDATTVRSDMARHVATPSSKGEFANPQAGSLGTIIGAFNSAATRRINQRQGTPSEPVWQRNDHDRILRDEGNPKRSEVHASKWRGARRYIQRNPAQWTDDMHHPTQP